MWLLYYTLVTYTLHAKSGFVYAQTLFEHLQVLTVCRTASDPYFQPDFWTVKRGHAW